MWFVCKVLCDGARFAFVCFVVVRACVKSLCALFVLYCVVLCVVYCVFVVFVCVFQCVCVLFVACCAVSYGSHVMLVVLCSCDLLNMCRLWV